MDDAKLAALILIVLISGGVVFTTVYTNRDKSVSRIEVGISDIKSLLGQIGDKVGNISIGNIGNITIGGPLDVNVVNVTKPIATAPNLTELLRLLVGIAEDLVKIEDAIRGLNITVSGNITLAERLKVVVENVVRTEPNLTALLGLVGELIDYTRAIKSSLESYMYVYIANRTIATKPELGSIEVLLNRIDRMLLSLSGNVSMLNTVVSKESRQEQMLNEIDQISMSLYSINTYLSLLLNSIAKEQKQDAIITRLTWAVGNLSSLLDAVAKESKQNTMISGLSQISQNLTSILNSLSQLAGAVAKESKQDAIIDKLNKVMLNLTSLLDAVSKEAKQDMIISRLDQVLQSLSSVHGSLTQLINVVSKESKQDAIISSLSEIAPKLNNIVGNLTALSSLMSQLLNAVSKESKQDAIIARLDQISRNLTAVSNAISQLTSVVAKESKQDTIISRLDQISQTLSSISTSLSQLVSVVAKESKQDTMISQLNSVISRLDQVLQSLSSIQTTLNQLTSVVAKESKQDTIIAKLDQIYSAILSLGGGVRVFCSVHVAASALAANKIHIVLWNPTTTPLYVARILVSSEVTATVTGFQVAFRVNRITAYSGGTTVTPAPFNTATTCVGTGVSAPTSATTAATLMTIAVNQEETGGDVFRDINLFDMPIVLRQNEGLAVVQYGTAGTGSVSITIIYYTLS